MHSMVIRASEPRRSACSSCLGPKTSRKSLVRNLPSLRAADAVIDLSAYPQAPLTLDVVQSLREKSLLKRQDTPYEARYVHYKSL